MKTILLPFQESYIQPLAFGLSLSGIEAITCGKWGSSLDEELPVIQQHQPNIIHLHWPESLWGKAPLSSETRIDQLETALTSLKSTSATLVWTMHNFKPHDDSHDAEKASMVYQLFADHVDGCIHHSNWGKQTVLSKYQFNPKCVHTTINHGNKIETQQPAQNQDALRQELNLPCDHTIYLSVGVVRHYKNLELLIKTITQRNKKEILLIAGGIQEVHYYKQLVSLANGSTQIAFLGYIEKPILDKIVAASDFLISAHGQQSLTSAAPHLSLQYGKPLICPESPYCLEVLESSVYYYSDQSETQLNQCLDKIKPQDNDELKRQLSEKRTVSTWREIGKITAEFYQSLLNTTEQS